jgi:DNA-binding beta-propeller fold protein YncE
LSNSGAIIAAGYTGGSIDVPYGIAIDGSGNAWIANYGGISNSTISEIVSSGTALSPVSGSPYSESGSYGPQAIAIDGAGNAWVANNSNSSIAELSGGGAMLSPSAGYTGSGTLNGPNAIAVDPSGNVWIANNSNNTVTELIGAAAPVVTPLAVGAKNNTLGTKP